MVTTKVELIPWDPESPDHIARLVVHREECGWHAEKVANEWADKQRAGTKCIYWIVYHSDGSADFDAAMQRHLAKHPSDKTLLADTGKSLRDTPRVPSGVRFHPVGHISLDSESPDAVAFGVKAPLKDAWWIKSLYVFLELRSFGIARSAMDQVESQAVNEPLNARHLMLDTGFKEDVKNPSLGPLFYGQIPPLTPHEWYERRGYRVIQIVKDMYKLDGKDMGMRTVILQRDVV
ncbi:unnamed protein product [Clonostachys rosea f. rosea IK726]|uniref:N-acetyltransferase domain-containing protein n=2 Tax=Bionectria ochroleuca TaxID=29856 RepID=A0A0B7KBZ6_BIOOC|nr:unnamed protein product [Clonostachys rosea f. rosea IK726]